MGNGFFTVCGIIEIKDRILLVRHTYGTAKDRILVPGGYVEENELPNIAIEREIFEETGVVAKAKCLLSIQFKTNQWCPVFKKRLPCKERNRRKLCFVRLRY